MFIVRSTGQQPEGLEVKLGRRTPSLVATAADQVDWFCLGDAEAARRGGLDVVLLHDGWYADDTGGGVAVFGAYWEIRDTPFSVKEVAPDPSPATQPREAGETVNVRKAIFGT